MNKQSISSFFEFKRCQRCLNPFLFRRFYLRNKQIYIEVQCPCLNSFGFLRLEQLIKYFSPIEKMITRKNYCYFLNNNNWKIIINKKNEIFKEFKCNCNQRKVKYCIDCKKLICNKCLQNHSYHKLFYYEPKIFISDRELNKLEKYCYQSYINLKEASRFIQIELKNTNSIKDLNDYVNNYEKINDSLYALFKLLLLKFKNSRTFTNYLNLSHFGYCNEPFAVKEFQYLSKRIGKRFNLKNIFFQYYQSNFLIPVLSNCKYFSFAKKMKLIIRKEYNDNYSFLRYFKVKLFFKKTISSFYQGKIINKHLLTTTKSNLQLPVRVKNVLVLKDGRLALTFYYQLMSILIYTLDLKNYSFSFNMKIKITGEIVQFIQYDYSNLYVIDMPGNLYRIELRKNDYKYYNNSFAAYYWVELDYPKVLLLRGSGIYYYKKGVLNKKKYNKRKIITLPSFEYCEYGHKLSNGLVLIKRNNIFYIMQINTKNKIVKKFEFEGWRGYPAFYENIKKKILYIQMKVHILLLSTKTFQVLSIYTNFHFLFYPLPNNDLMSYFEHINFDFRKISNSMLKKGCKDIFQISNNLLLVSTPQNFYLYKIN